MRLWVVSRNRNSDGEQMNWGTPSWPPDKNECRKRSESGDSMKPPYSAESLSGGSARNKDY
jgi:hypothetical protein